MNNQGLHGLCPHEGPFMFSRWTDIILEGKELWGVPEEDWSPFSPQGGASYPPLRTVVSDNDGLCALCLPISVSWLSRAVSKACEALCSVFGSCLF